MYLNYTQNTGWKGYSLRLLLAFLSCLLFAQIQAQQTVSFSEMRRKFDRECAHAKDPCHAALLFYRTTQQLAFQSNQDKRELLGYIEMKASEHKSGYYAQLCTEIAEGLHNTGQMHDSYYFLYKAQNALRSNPPTDSRFLGQFHKNIGLIFYYFQRFNEARMHFHQAAASSEIDDRDRIDILNTLGLINREQGYSDSSRIYFERALVLAKKLNHTPWTAVISGNLGQYYWIRKDFAKARELCEFDARYSQETHQNGSAITALALLSEMDLYAGDLNGAADKIHRIEALMGESKDPGLQRIYYRTLTAYQEKTGSYQQALDSYKKMVRYMDTLRKQTAIDNIRKTEFQIDFEHKQAEISLLHEKKKRDELIIYGLLGITVIIIFVSAILINFIAKRRRREKEIARLKQTQVEQELSNTEKEMRHILSNLMEKNELIEQLSEKVNQFQSSSEEEALSEEKLNLLNALQSFTLLTDDDWLEFKKLFEKLNPHFFTRILSHSPDLTNAEIRLVTLIKLNLSNLEMSRALGISPDSVRKTSLRLRKKLNIELHEELVKFILTL